MASTRCDRGPVGRSLGVTVLHGDRGHTVARSPRTRGRNLPPTVGRGEGVTVPSLRFRELEGHQFFCVTHNRLTMHQASRLIGVATGATSASTLVKVSLLAADDPAA